MANGWNTSQIDYYRARAKEYDEWFFRRGRYDRGEPHKKCWFEEMDEVRTSLEAVLTDDVLELACGTGLWTRLLADGGRRVHAVDAAPEMLDMARTRVPQRAVTLEQVDLFDWTPSRTYSFVFFAFFLSHVPRARFEDFWRLVDAVVAPGGRFFLVDSRYTPLSTANDHKLEAPDGDVVTRRLNDGRVYDIVKIFHRADDLEQRLARLGWTADIRETDTFFLYGSGIRA